MASISRLKDSSVLLCEGLVNGGDFGAWPLAPFNFDFMVPYRHCVGPQGRVSGN